MRRLVTRSLKQGLGLFGLVMGLVLFFKPVLVKASSFDNIPPRKPKVWAVYDSKTNGVKFEWRWQGDKTCLGCEGPVGYCTSSGISNKGFECNNQKNPPFWWHTVDNDTKKVLHKSYSNQPWNKSFKWNSSNATYYVESCNGKGGHVLRVDVKARDARGNISSHVTAKAVCPIPTQIVTPTPTPIPTPVSLQKPSLKVVVSSGAPECTNDIRPVWKWKSDNHPVKEILIYRDWGWVNPISCARNTYDGTCKLSNWGYFKPRNPLSKWGINRAFGVRIRKISERGEVSPYSELVAITLDTVGPSRPEKIKVKYWDNDEGGMLAFAWPASEDVGCAGWNNYNKAWYYWLQGWWKDKEGNIRWVINDSNWQPANMLYPEYYVSCAGHEGDTFTLGVRQAKDKLGNVSQDLGEMGNIASYTCPRKESPTPVLLPDLVVSKAVMCYDLASGYGRAFIRVRNKGNGPTDKTTILFILKRVTRT